jgi:hypothetical protein
LVFPPKHDAISTSSLLGIFDVVVVMTLQVLFKFKKLFEGAIFSVFALLVVATATGLLRYGGNWQGPLRPPAASTQEEWTAPLSPYFDVGRSEII